MTCRCWTIGIVGAGITSAYRHGGQLVFLLDAERLVAPAMEIPPAELPSLPSEAP